MIQYQVIELDNLPERYNENLLKKSQLTMEENDNVMLNLRLGVKASGLNNNLFFYRLFTKI